jgi:cysteinyl-tRNA synthetase
MIKVYNTLAGGKVELVPLTGKKIGMYVCGPTVYDAAHLGHARAAVTFDVVNRYLRKRGYDVTYVRNYTDVDDKIIARANERGVPSHEISERYIEEFEADMAALGVGDPDVKPKVTEHIPEIVALISRLIAGGAAYAVEGDVYYSVSSFDGYGKLSNRDREGMEAGARVEVDLKKRDPLDFALWKKAKPGEPFWESPWGQGRPGWHIECSAMSMKYLGETFDIHGGGKDLIFPHHENEIAQSERATGKPFSKFWLHNGFVNVNAEKMSKSLGNFMTVREVLEQFHPETVRLFLLSAQYRTPIDFTLKNLEEAEKQLERFYAALAAAQKVAPGAAELDLKDIAEPAKTLWYAVDDFTTRFDEAMEDDFNTALAIGYVYDVVREINKVAVPMAGAGQQAEAQLAGVLGEIRKRLVGAGDVLGLFQCAPQAYLDDLHQRRIGRAPVDTALVDRLVAERIEARKAKNFKRADEIRDQLATLGVELEDKPGQTVWKLRS